MGIAPIIDDYYKQLETIINEWHETGLLIYNPWNEDRKKQFNLLQISGVRKIIRKAASQLKRPYVLVEMYPNGDAKIMMPNRRRNHALMAPFYTAGTTGSIYSAPIKGQYDVYYRIGKTVCEFAVRQEFFKHWLENCRTSPQYREALGISKLPETEMNNEAV